jgi:hypothetical protein
VALPQDVMDESVEQVLVTLDLGKQQYPVLFPAANPAEQSMVVSVESGESVPEHE